jgi:hypothetical protein
MKTSLFRILLTLLLLLGTLCTSSCIFDSNEAVNLKDSVQKEITVLKDSTRFQFTYTDLETPIETYDIIHVEIEYYRDYQTRMKTKNFFFEVPDDITYGEQPSFTVEIEDALGDESVVYVSVEATYKAESSSRFWLFVLAVIISLVLLILLWSAYAALCDEHGSNTSLPSFMWLGGMGIYLVVAILVAMKWGNGPGSIVFCGSGLYFICTLFTYFSNRE